MKFNKYYLTGFLIILIIISVIIKKKERFTQDERKNLLDNIKVQNDLFKSVFSKITNNDVNIPKKLITEKDLDVKKTLYSDSAVLQNDLNLNKGSLRLGNKVRVGNDGTIYAKNIKLDSNGGISYKSGSHGGSYWRTVDDGYYGNWRGGKSCGHNEYVCGLEVRIEGKQGGGDDTAMNGIKMRCCKFNLGK